LPVAARACGRGNALAALGIFIAGAAAGVALAAVAGKQPGRTPAAAGAPAPIASAVPSGGYSVEVVRLSDGDTFEARVLVWPGVEIVTKVRLRGIDAPELSARCRDEYAKAIAARD